MENEKPLNRQNWLKAKGFPIDPFDENSFHAETDPLLNFTTPLNSRNVSSYIDRGDIDSLVGDFESPGYRFIFSKFGGGKSGLRKRIHHKYESYDGTQSLGIKQRALIVDYIEHVYPPDEADIHHHVSRIIDFVYVALNKAPLNDEERLVVYQSPKQALLNLVQTCKEFEYDGIYVLVDNLDTQSFEKILSLAHNTNRLNIKGFIIKFFFPENLFFLSQATLQFVKSPPYFLGWSEEDLSQILNQRLTTCLDPAFQVASMKPMGVLFDQRLGETIEDVMIKLGMFGNSPRLMWQLGNYLLDEYIKTTTAYRGYEFFAKAQIRLFDDILISDMTIGHKLESNIDFLLKSGKRRPKPKVKIFICCDSQYEQIVHDGLYQELKAENYIPWMEGDIFAGQDTDFVINSKIKEADFFLACLSSQSENERGLFRREISLALNKWERLGLLKTDIFIIPLRLEECGIPDELKRFEHIDFFSKNYRSKLFMALKEGMKRRKGKKR